MKKIIGLFLILSLILIGSGWAAESVEFKNVKRDGGFSYIQWTVVTAADGSLTKTAAEESICGLIYGIEIIPDDTTAFTDAVTDVRVTVNSVDITEGGADNLSNSVTTPVSTIFGGYAMSFPINGLLSIDILDNLVDSGACVVKVYYLRCGGNR